MATMFPDAPSPATESRAEVRLFEALRDGLGDDFVAFHHVAWLAKGREGARVGEADFVVAHPRLGAVVVEAKGGRIRYDAERRQFYSANRTGEFEIKDPFEQARRSAFALADALQRRSEPPPHIGYAVAFPDAEVGRQDLRLDAPREVVIGGEDLTGLERRVKGVLEYWNSRSRAFGDVGALKRLLANSFEIRAPLSLELDEDERELLRLTEAQFRILDMLARQTRVAIGGCAGSGKTFIAAEKARRLAKQGFSVLVCCFNRLLSEHLRRHLADVKEIEVLAYDELCEKVVRQHDGSIEKLLLSDRTVNWNRLRERFADVVVDSPVKYDALIVDEAQDFFADWWLPLQLALRAPDTSPLYIFFDDNQRLFSGSVDFPVAGAPIQLTINCRNTQAINELVKFYYSGSEIEALGPAGLPIEWHLYKTRDELMKLLDSILTRLRTEAGLGPGDVALLTAHGQDQSVLWRTDRIGGWRLTEDPWSKDQVLRASVYRFKGLERRVVIALELDAAKEDALYVLFSRPSLYLGVLVSPPMLKQLPFKIQRRLTAN
jgi:hypothetical protein